MKTTREVITPAIAKQMLELNVSNRTLTHAVAARYAREMKNGRWKDTGEPIHFSMGLLVNGQHRLVGIVESGVSLEMVVIRDFPEDAVACLDIGKSRTNADVLTLNGYHNTKCLAAAIRCCQMIKFGIATSSGERKLSPPEVLQLAETEYRGLDEWVVMANAHHKTAPMGKGVFAALAFAFAAKNRELAQNWCDVMTGHATVSPKHPFHLLREKLLKRKQTIGAADVRLVLAMCIKAWNMVRDGKLSITVFNFTDAEAYPKVK